MEPLKRDSHWSPVLKHLCTVLLPELLVVESGDRHHKKFGQQDSALFRQRWSVHIADSGGIPLHRGVLPPLDPRARIVTYFLLLDSSHQSTEHSRAGRHPRLSRHQALISATVQHPLLSGVA